MTEKMLMTVEAALWRVLDASLKQADAMYPGRGSVDTQYLLHLQCVQSILAWHATQMMGVRKRRLAARPRGPIPATLMGVSDDSDDWDLLLDLFGLPVGESWMMSVGLAALPYEIRLMLVQMTFILELSITDSVRCLSELQVMADALQSDKRSMGGKGIALGPAQAPNRQQLDQQSQALADRVKKMMQPLAPVPKNSLRTFRRP